MGFQKQEHFKGTYYSVTASNVYPSLIVDPQIYKDQEFCCAVLHGDLKTIDMYLQNGADINTRTCFPPPIYLALKFKMFRVVKHLLERGANINIPHTTGFFAGYTILHHACEEKKQKIIKTLLFRYNADPNYIANNGAQPIHVAVLLGRLKTVNLLLKAGAYADAILSRSLCAKYLADFKWEEKYGIGQTLLTYAIFNRNAELVSILMNNNANPNISNDMNKTLLMYIMENNLKDIGLAFIPKLSRQDINRRDKNGLAAIHYLMGLDKPKNSRKIIIDDDVALFVELLFHAGGNLDATVNGDQKTKLFNFAVNKGLWNTVYFLVYHHSYHPPPAGLLLYTIQGGDIYKKDPQMLFLGNCRAQNILYTLYSRPAFNFPVFEEAVNLMKDLVDNHADIAAFVKDECEQKLQFSIDQLEKTIVPFGTQKISIYAIINKTHDELITLVRNKEFIKAFNNLVISDDLHSDENFQLLKIQINKLQRRIYLLRRYDKIWFTEKDAWCKLPYDCMLYIIDHLDDDSLKNFIHAYLEKKFI